MEQYKTEVIKETHDNKAPFNETISCIRIESSEEALKKKCFYVSIINLILMIFDRNLVKIIK